jgi:hypothetical protein
MLFTVKVWDILPLAVVEATTVSHQTISLRYSNQITCAILDFEGLRGCKHLIDIGCIDQINQIALPVRLSAPQPTLDLLGYDSQRLTQLVHPVGGNEHKQPWHLLSPRISLTTPKAPM